MRFLKLLMLTIILISCTADDDIGIIGTTEDFIIQSSIINDSYPIYVFLPENYANNSLNQLIIALDGETRFNSIASIISKKTQEGSMPPSIFIAIGNIAERNRDYTPTVYAHGSGGGRDFYQFIKEELVALCENGHYICDRIGNGAKEL